ncbi:KamA family radical SAM protein [Candidatus Pacearchaeota archaeon]|nr:KamA family radical SAM protein [Candidatus Pacearchaeota archaeon]
MRKQEIKQQIEIIVPLWEEILKKSIVNDEQLCKILKGKVNAQDIKKVIEKYPMNINPYYLSLIKKQDDAIWKQCIPDIREVEDDFGFDDPLHEEEDSPVYGLTHRYPDRVLLLVSNKCAMYCRFCTRKRKVGVCYKSMSKEDIQKGIEYIKQHKEVRDVILSGGDPLLLKDDELEFILKSIREIKHIEIIRIGTRVPCTLPQRITPELCAMLKKYHPLYINTHFNHPDEIRAESKRACTLLADAGIPLGNQSVLLRGINDNPAVMKKLMQKLLTIRVKPYYVYQADLTKGTNHFRTKVSEGIDIIRSLRGYTSGMCVPHFVIDAPGGGGKIPITPNYVVNKEGNSIKLKNYEDKEFEYIEPG